VTNPLFNNDDRDPVKGKKGGSSFCPSSFEAEILLRVEVHSKQTKKILLGLFIV
jgi:hypothetical protein